jgi:hypothetical protein
MARGLWRIDALALARIGGACEPAAIPPAAALRDGAADAGALARLTRPDSLDHLVTMPGDAYTLLFPLPETADRHELFLESRGYYLEWIRDEWLAEEDPARLARLLIDPEGALREMAPAYKKIEPAIEAAFWRSRYAP